MFMLRNRREQFGFGDKTVSNAVTATVAVGTSPIGVAVTHNGEYVYITNEGSNSVSVISTASNTVTRNIPVGEWHLVM